MLSVIDLPKRTFFNHRDAILDMFGLEIKRDRTLPLHHSQQDTETNDRYSIFKYHVVPSFDF